MTTLQIIRAAAGTGKTTRLTQLYLEQLQTHPVQHIVAITYTRKAAAELIERVSQVLWALTAEDSHQKQEAIRRLGPELKLYDKFAPTEPERIVRALSDLGEAPVGTTDSFVQRLLTEFALDVRLPIPGGETVMPDIPIEMDDRTDTVFADEARSLLTDADTPLDDDLRRLLVHYTLSDVASLLAVPRDTDISILSPQRGRVVTDALARQLVAGMEGGEDGLRGILTDCLGVDPEPGKVRDLWEGKWLRKPAKKYPERTEAVDRMHAWLCDPDAQDDIDDDTLEAFWSTLVAGGRKLFSSDSLPPLTAPVTAAAFRQRVADQVPGVGLRDGLRYLLKAGIHPSLIREAFNQNLRQMAKRALDRVVEWYFTPGTPIPGLELLVFLGYLNKQMSESVRVQMLDRTAVGLDGALRDYPLEVRVSGDRVWLPLTDLARSLCPWAGTDSDILAEIEDIRSTVHRYRETVSRRARQRMAMEARFSYADLLRAAEALLAHARTTPDHPLRDRFRVLLVDEVQDSSPAQMRFYRAMIHAGNDIRATFVGDSRQSIYLFQDADPAGMNRLSDPEWIGEVTLKPEETLTKNYRSSRRMVAAQKALFGPAFADEARACLLKGLEPVTDETLSPGRPEEGLDHVVRIVAPIPKGPDAKKTIQLMNQAALEAFAGQLIRCWAESDPNPPSAAVLCRTWKEANGAAEMLNAFFRFAGCEGRAFVDRDTAWRESRVMQDLCILLAAFLDRTDMTAWLGVWKLPMVGLSDRALAQMALAPDAPWNRGAPCRLRALLDAPDPGPDADPMDAAAFDVAAPLLRQACRQIGTLPLCDILETLARELGWREVLAADPADDATEFLDHAIEWIRDLESQGRSPSEILDILTGVIPSEVPSLHIHRKGRHVSCTTVFQAKGLKWDHVCVLSPGSGPGQGGGRDKSVFADTKSEAVFIPDRLGTDAGDTHLLTPVRLDITRTFQSKTGDRISGLLSSIRAHRFREEHLRLTYVAVTRAAQSVTLGLSEKDNLSAPAILYRAWAKSIYGPIWDEPDWESVGTETPDTVPGMEKMFEAKVPPGLYPTTVEGVVHRVFKGIVTIPDVLVLGSVTESAAGAAGDFAPPVLTASRWRRRTPSSLHQALEPDDGKALVERILNTAVFLPGADAPLAPPSEAGLGTLSERDFGTLVHGWFEDWGFDGAPDADRALAFLTHRWPAELAEAHRRVLSQWLVEVSVQLQQVSLPMLERVMSARRRVFEMPLVAPVAMDRGTAYLLSGKPDLLVETAPDRWTLIDFKAGHHGPTARTRTPSQQKAHAHLHVYGPQLEGYARAINQIWQNSNRRVTEAVLWFVRTGATVTWPVE